MFKFLPAAAAAVALSFTVVSAADAATVFSGNYEVTELNSSGPGLQVSVSPNPGDVNFTLDAPSFSQSGVQLFKIWTNENSVQADDFNGSSISVNFTFTAPAAGSGQVGGVTYGEASFLGFFQNGAVQWGGPSVIDFGQYGLLTISLSDAIFNEGSWWGLNEGKKYGEYITADFSLAPPMQSAVPEPATWAMMIMGFGLAGSAIRRRRTAFAVAA